MKDKYPDSYSSRLPACPLRTECIQMIDEIEALQSIFDGREASGDVEEALSKQHALRLVGHIHICEECQAAVKKARAMRNEQRSALHDLLSEGEFYIPPTTASILAAIRDDQSASMMKQDNDDTSKNEPEELITSPSNKRGKSTQPQALRASKNIQARTSRYSSLAVVAAAAMFLFIAAQLFQSFYAVRDSNTKGAARVSNVAANVNSSQGIQSNAAAFTQTNAWSSVVISYVTVGGKQRMVVNYDPATGKATPLLTASTNISVDGVSHNGHDLVYHDYDDNKQQTTYYLLSGAAVVLNGKGLNAVWSQSDAAIFAALVDGSVWRIDVKTKQPLRLPFNVQADKLAFMRNQYLYYVQGKSLYRIDVTASSADAAQLIVANADIDTYWLNLNNETVYYVQNDGSQYDTYEVPGDSALVLPQLLMKNAIPIGYDANTNLETMSWNTQAGTFDVRTVDTSGSSDAVSPFVSNVAPGAVALCSDKSMTIGKVCNNSIALSPYGKTLVVGAKYKDNTYKIVSVDLKSHNQTALTPILGGTQIALIGWDKLIV